MSRLRIAIVGLGPWGVCVVERLVSCYRQLTGVKRGLAIHCFDSKSPGAGVHDPLEPDYLLLNTVVGQVSLFAAASRDGLLEDYGGKTFLQWARYEGYTLDEDGPRRGANGRMIEETDFLPRALFGRYAAWAYQQIIRSLPDGIALHQHVDEVVSVRAQVDGTERLTTTSRATVDVDHVFLTTGHTKAKRDERVVPPYPISEVRRRVADGATVAISGMGLVAVDVVTALTYGRGGRFHRDGNRLRYEASGREPRIRLFSRSGLCPHCRPASTLDSTGVYEPRIFNADSVARIRAEKHGRAGSRQLDFEVDMAPLLWAELRVHYQTERIRLLEGDAAASDLAGFLTNAWKGGALDEALANLPRFDPEHELFRPELDRCADRVTYQRTVRQALAEDVEDSRAGEARSPRKAAFELIRVLRDVIRAAVDDSGLTSESFLAFRRRFAGAFNRVTVGPPLQRGEELLALMDANVVTMPFGRAPQTRFCEASRSWRVSSTRLEQAHSEQVDALIVGHLELPNLTTTASQLLSSLAADERIRPFHRSEKCGIALDRQHHPISVSGESSERLWVLGPLSEGVRYFTNYLPSPRSRFRAFDDVASCAQDIFSQVGWY